ncbi:MAG: alpha/beta hydrolase [Methylophilus sp.]|nr:alpha/beta hydrolase [Methylophilus sp.]
MQSTHIVLLPGLDGTGLLFQPFTEALPRHLIPIVLHYPTDKALGYNDLLPRVLSQLPKGIPYFILGESFGGPLSLSVAAQKPEGLKGIILCATFVSCPYAWIPHWATWIVPSSIFGASPLIAKISAYFGAYYSATLYRALASVKSTVFAHRIREVIAVDVSRELAECQLPILYLQGKRDFVVPRSNLKRIMALNPSVQYSQLEASHMVLQNQPQEAAKVIDMFIQQHLYSHSTLHI